MGYWAEKLKPSLDEHVLARLHDVPAWRVGYFEMQRTLGRTHLVPLLTRLGLLPGAGRILEVGAGEGGVLTALVENSARRGTGLELSLERTDIAHRIARALDLDIDFQAGDVTQRESLTGLGAPFDIVLFRDVIEHIPDLDAALENARALTRDDGCLVFSFPPFWSPFGAHQQIASRRSMRLPWVQNAPRYRPLVALCERDDDKRRELLELRDVALTLSRFERALARHGLTTVDRSLYLSRPIFTVRWGLPTVGAGPVGRIPFLRELLVTGAWYVVKK
jgi:2-polyprenyl-3-methyl-5-hydroxy-6-metoxy-1,4-benzoquinol methylase